MRVNKSTRAFFELLRAGLWSNAYANLNHNYLGIKEFKDIEWGEVYRSAEEQSVIGLVAAGIEELRAKNCGAVDVPQEWALQFIGQTLQIEQRNKAMNEFVAELIEDLRKKDIYALLVKGQGIAQCYERSLWRTCGDVDLLLSETNYEKAKAYLVPQAERTETEFKIFKHYGMTIKGWEVELHGTLRPRLSNRIDRGVDEAQKDVFYGGSVRSWQNGKTQVYIPAPDDDIIFQITHILKHFYQGGVGLRQFCDLSRFLWTFRGKIDTELLNKRLNEMGIMSEWKAFGVFVHEYLGTPVEVIPLLDSLKENESRKFKHKAKKICEFVMEVGNFGHNRDNSYYRKYPYVIKKAVSLWWRTADSFRHFTIFPKNSVKIWFHVLTTGVKVAARGK